MSGKVVCSSEEMRHGHAMAQAARIKLRQELDRSPRRAMNRYSASLLALGLLASCAPISPSVSSTDDPANPEAPEATVRPIRDVLGADSLTRKSRQILAQAANERQLDQSSQDAGHEQGGQMKDGPGMPPAQPLPQPSPAPTLQQHQAPGRKVPQEQSQLSPTPNN
jgi:hypothetical protein